MNDLKGSQIIVRIDKCGRCGCHYTAAKLVRVVSPCPKCNYMGGTYTIIKEEDEVRVIPNDTPPVDSTIKFKPLGVVNTVGELRNLLSNYKDEDSFGFINQSMQELHERKYPEFTVVAFQ